MIKYKKKFYRGLLIYGILCLLDILCFEYASQGFAEMIEFKWFKVEFNCGLDSLMDKNLIRFSQYRYFIV